MPATSASATTVDTSAWYVLLNRNSCRALDVNGAFGVALLGGGQDSRPDDLDAIVVDVGGTVPGDVGPMA